MSFYDGNGNAITNDHNLELWIRKQPVKLAASNYAFINYSDVNEQGKFIASVGNYAQLLNIRFVTEDYELDVGHFYNEESFLIGKKCKILLNARLTLNNIIMNLQLLTNIHIKVVTVNTLDVKSYYEFELQQWSPNAEETI